MENFNLIPIENEGKRVLTTAQLAEAYETNTKTITDNFGNNRKRYIEGKHFYCLTGNELKAFKSESENFGFAPNLNKLYLWTEKGALLHAKSLNTDKAWEVYDFLVENYFQKKAPDYSSLSPQLQFMIKTEQKQKELETAIETANRRIDNMCETMKVRGDNWRKDTRLLINRIVSATGEDYGDIYLDIYNTIEYRADCDLTIRLNNMIKRLRKRGIPEHKIDDLNKIDVIAADKKLTEIYIAVVKEMAVKCNIWRK